MARWTVVRGAQELILKAADGEISLDVPSGVPFIADVHTAEEIRAKLGAAIGAAMGGERS